MTPFTQELLIRGQVAVMMSVMKLSMAALAAKPTPAATPATAGPPSWAQVAQRMLPSQAPMVKISPHCEDHTIALTRASCKAITGDNALLPTLTKRANTTIRAVTKSPQDPVVAAQYLWNNNVVLMAATPPPQAMPLRRRLGEGT